MAHRSDPFVLTLHALRLKGFAEPPAIVEFYEIPETDVLGALDHGRSEGLVDYRDGRLSGFLLTPDGRREGERLLADELDTVGAREEVEHAYETFLGLNQELLRVCTTWQMRDVDGSRVANDHADERYDRSVVADLVALDEKLRPVLLTMRARLSRFDPHGRRLRFALEQLVDGHRDYFTKPMFPSYHTIWFELHEDLLATLNIDRANEGSTR